MAGRALDDRAKREFGERGYVVAPGVVSAALIERAMRAVDAAIQEQPPPDGTRGPHFSWPQVHPGHPLLDLLTESPALSLAQSLVGPWRLQVPTFAQIALNIPHFDHRPGRHHLDGATPPPEEGIPGTFTLLVGVMLTDQTERHGGNLWVWPATHYTHAEHFTQEGPDALIAAGGYPPIDLPAPEQVVGRAGDVLFAHYLLAHNIGGNVSGQTRRMIYLRLEAEGHRARWRDFMQDALLELGPVRAALATEAPSLK
jgi:hypothetical protein